MFFSLYRWDGMLDEATGITGAAGRQRQVVLVVSYIWWTLAMGKTW